MVPIGARACSFHARLTPSSCALDTQFLRPNATAGKMAVEMNDGDMAWVLTSAALVQVMTPVSRAESARCPRCLSPPYLTRIFDLQGLAFFYVSPLPEPCCALSRVTAPVYALLL